MTLVRWILTIVVIALILLSIAAGLFVVATRSGDMASLPTPPAEPSRAADPPALVQNTAAPAPAPMPQVIATYRDLVRSLPGLQEASPSDTQLPFTRLARIHLKTPAYICPRGDLWLSHPAAPPIRTLLNDLLTHQTHIVRERVVFVHWQKIGKQQEPWPIIRDDTGRCTLLPLGKPEIPLERTDYHWSAASTFDSSSIVVPCASGVAVIKLGDHVTQDYRQLSPKPQAQPQIAFTNRGFIAWTPVSDPGSATTTVRYAEGQFVEGFSKGDWTGPFIHLIPFMDGSVLQVRPAGAGSVKLSITALETNPIDNERVAELVRDLADDDRETRDEANAELASLGPSTWAHLEALLPGQPPEAQIRIRQIIRARREPTLGRFKPVDDRLQTVWRLRDGGVIFLAENGVTSAGQENDPVIPAWICVRPGRPISLLPPMLTRSLAVGTVDLEILGNRDWAVSDEADGAMLFFGQELIHITTEKDYAYRTCLGADREARILLAPANAQEYGSEFLLVDPRLPDPTPVLQMWSMPAQEGGVFGWDPEGWPAVQRGEAKPWALRENSWKTIDGTILQTAPIVPSTNDGPLTLSQIGTLQDGATVWKGGEFLELRTADGKALRQRRPRGLPAGDAGAVIQGNHLYILHLAGQLSRLKISPGQPQPFAMEAVFAENVPLIDVVKRMWVDPAGRVCIAGEDGQLVILFTGKAIPHAIQDLIPIGELKDARAEPAPPATVPAPTPPAN